MEINMITKYVTSTYETTDAYKKILLEAKDAKVKIEESNDDDTRLVFFEKKDIFSLPLRR